MKINPSFTVNLQIYYLQVDSASASYDSIRMRLMKLRPTGNGPAVGSSGIEYDIVKNDLSDPFSAMGKNTCFSLSVDPGGPRKHKSIQHQINRSNIHLIWSDKDSLCYMRTTNNKVHNLRSNC